jgi:hypothetical protein
VGERGRGWGKRERGWRKGGRNDPNIVCTYEKKKFLKNQWVSYG